MLHQFNVIDFSIVPGFLESKLKLIANKLIVFTVVKKNKQSAKDKNLDHRASFSRKMLFDFVGSEDALLIFSI